MNSKYKLAVFDMDGTMINGRLIETLSIKFRLFDKIRKIQIDDSMIPYAKTREIAFLLKGIEENEIKIALESIPLMTNLEKVISLLKKEGVKIGIITDSYGIAARTLVDKLDLNFFVANHLNVSDGKITGEIQMPMGWEKINCSCNLSVCKRYHLELHAKKYGIDIENTIAIGDTRGDVCMINGAGLGIAFMPKDKYINSTKYIIKIPDLLGVLDYMN